MQTLLICLAIIVAAFAISLFVWWLLQPKVIRPSTTRKMLGTSRAASQREYRYQNQCEASKRAAEQNRRDEEAFFLHQQPSCRSFSRNDDCSGSSNNDSSPTSLE